MDRGPTSSRAPVRAALPRARRALRTGRAGVGAALAVAAACGAAGVAGGITGCLATADEVAARRSAAVDARLTASAARVTLAATADAPFTLEHRASGVRVAVRLVGARHVASVGARDAPTYPGGAPGGGDLRFATRPDGVEDFVRYAHAPEAGHLAYGLELGAAVAGLRLVDDVLELLDARGTPRLRMNAPTARDATGRSVRLRVELHGCAYDASPRAPFARPPIPPGAPACEVRVHHGAGVAWPAELDPAWTTTASLPSPRYNHLAERLPSGHVLIAGGMVPDPVTTEAATTTAWTWDPATGTYAATGPLTTARGDTGTTRLPTGDVLVTGGLGGYGEITVGTAERYQAATGTFVPAGHLVAPRAGHSALRLGDGSVLVAGGYDNGAVDFPTAELWRDDAFTLTGNASGTRFFHGAAALPDGRAVLGGGTHPFQGSLASIDVYTPGVGFAPAGSVPPMWSARTLTSAAALPDGRVVFAGGYNAQEGELRSAEIYDPATNRWTRLPVALGRARYGAVARALTDGRVLFVGGQTLAREHADGELFDPATLGFVRVAPEASDERAFGHSVTDLDDGRALVAGGWDVGPPRMLQSALVLDPTLPTPDAGPDDDLDAGAYAGPRDAADDARPRDPHEGETLLDAAWLGEPVDAAAAASPSAPAGGAPDAPDPGAGERAWEAGGGCAAAPSGRTRPEGATGLALGLALALSGVRAWRAGGRGRCDRARPSSPRPSGFRGPRP